MASINKVFILGNCGRDPEVRYLPSGMAVANTSIATSSLRKNKKTSEIIEETQWHRVTFYDRLAEIAGQYLKKGSPVYVEGRLKYGKYTDKNGHEQNTCDVVATEMQLLGQRQDAKQEKPPSASNQSPAKASSGFDDMKSDLDDDSIPF